MYYKVYNVKLASFSIVTAWMCRGGCYSIPKIAPLYLWSLPDSAECLARQYQVLVLILCHDLTWDWTLVSRIIWLTLYLLGQRPNEIRASCFIYNFNWVSNHYKFFNLHCVFLKFSNIYIQINGYLKKKRGMSKHYIWLYIMMFPPMNFIIKKIEKTKDLFLKILFSPEPMYTCRNYIQIHNYVSSSIWRVSP